MASQTVVTGATAPRGRVRVRNNRAIEHVIALGYERGPDAQTNGRDRGTVTLLPAEEEGALDNQGRPMPGMEAVRNRVNEVDPDQWAAALKNPLIRLALDAKDLEVVV